jgi:hypothetical protein
VRRRRRRLLLFLLLLSTLGLFLVRLPQWAAALVAQQLSGTFGRPVSVGSVNFRLLPLEVELLEIRVAALEPGDPPTIEVPRAVVAPSLAPLRGRRLVLSRVRLEGPRIHIHAFPDPPRGPGGDDIPRLGGGAGGGLDVSINRLVIQGGEFTLDHERVPLDLDLPDFHGRLTERRGGGLQGRISFGPGPLRFGEAPEMPFATDIDLHFYQGLLTVDSARLTAQGTDLLYTGRIRFTGRPQGQFNMKGPVDLRLLERHVLRTGFGLEGASRFDGVLSVDGSRLRIEGHMEGTVGRFLGTDIPHYSGDVSYDGVDGLQLRDLELESLGGRATLEIDVPPGSSGTVRVAGPVQNADGEGLVRLVFGWDAFGVGSAASGRFDVTWPKGRPRLVSGRVGLDLAYREDGRTPLQGRVDWSAGQGRQHMERAEFKTPDGRARLEGTVEADDRALLAVDAESTDIAAIDDLLARVRRALGNKEAQKAGFGGEGTFRGRWTGTLHVPTFEGRFEGNDVAYLGVTWGRANWVGSADPDEVRSHSLVLRRAGAELWLDGRMQTGLFGQEDALDLQLRLTQWPAADIVKALDWNLDLDGPLSGEVGARGRRSGPEGEARLTSRGGRYLGVKYADGEVVARWRGARTEVTAGRAAVGGGALRFHGSLTDDGVYDGQAEASDVELSAILPALVPDVGLAGRASGSLLLQGTLARPRFTGSLRSPRLFLGDEGVGALVAELQGQGDGRVAVDARCRSARVDLALTGTVGAVAPYPVALTLKGRETSVDPFLRVVQPLVPNALGLVATGEVAIAGPAREPRGLSARATLSDLLVQLPEYPLRARGPVQLEVEDGALRLSPLHLSGEGTELELGGEADLAGDRPLALSLRGDADLRALSLVSRRLRGRGAARLAMSVTGTRREPQLEGTLSLEGAGVRVRGFPHGLEDVRGQVRFTEKAAELAEVRGVLAGGTLELEGQMTYANGALTSYDLPVTGRGLGLRYPEGLRSLVDADLRLFGDAQRQWVTGSIDVKQAVWSKRYDVASELLAVRPAAEVTESLEEGARLDLKLRAPGTLRVDNNLADLTARADLTIQGTTTNPVVLGRAEVDRGRIYFQGRTYVIRQGTLDFANPQRLDPLFDIEAETRIRSYRVTLRVGGTLERVTPNLTSDPPLSSVQILALLAGGDERDVANLTQAQAQANQGQYAATGAATLAAGKISEEVGLERSAERLLGLNRFSIDPSLVRGATTTPTARLNVGKRITPDLAVLYSQDLRSNDTRLISLEYTLRDWLSLLLTREDPTGGFGVDVRLRQAR